MSASAPPEAHSGDSLLSLAREFEQHLDRLSRSTAGERGRGDGLRERNEQLRERAGLARAAPVRDKVECEVGDDGGGVVRDEARRVSKEGRKPQAAGARGSAPPPLRGPAEADARPPGEPGGPLSQPLLGVARQSSKDSAEGSGAARTPGKALHRQVSKSRLQVYAARGSISRTWSGKRNDSDTKVRKMVANNREVNKARESNKEPVKYSQSYRTFWRNISVSMRVAFWCVFFGFPIYSEANYAVFFGSDQCSPSDIGRWVVGPNGTGIVPYEGTGIAPRPWRQEEDVWCGYLPGIFSTYWPNVIQMIIYTLYKNTGNTVMLAWQGIAGTWVAVANIWVLTSVWPKGAMDAGYIPWVAWLDCLGLSFLFLMSRMSTNAVKFGLSWHLYFMMVYMNPNTGPHIGQLPTGIPGLQWDSEPTAVLFTSYAGASLAVLATLLPWPMLNITKVHDDTKMVIDALDNIWEESIAYLCSGRHAAKRLQIATKITALSSTLKTIGGNLEASWWETLDLGRFKYKRALYADLDAEFDKLHHVLYTMKGCVVEAEFEQSHGLFMDESMSRAADNLKCATFRLLNQCADSCRDGAIDDDERKQMSLCAGEVKHCQMVMLLDYEEKLSSAFGKEVGADNPFCDTTFCNCTIFVYSLSVFAWRVRMFADKYIAGDQSFKRGSCVKQCCGWAYRAAEETEWDRAEHWNFAVRNTMSVSLCFVMGFYLRGSVFQKGYNSTMATTLALLISRYAGTTFEKNTKRLIGVALGKVVPILIMALVNLFECNSALQISAHVLSISIYVVIFEYMYFTSYQWDYVGLCAAAFGCTFFFTTCVQGGDSDSEIRSTYTDIGLVILAIAVQITVDTLMKSKDIRQIATVHIHELGQTIQEGFNEFFNGCDLDVSETYLTLMKSRIVPAEDFQPMADPHNAVFPGRHTPFKNQLYNTSVLYMRQVVSDFEMICMCRRAATELSKYMFGDHETIIDFLDELPSMEDVRLDFMSFIGLTRRGLDILLHHRTEDAIMDRELEELEDIDHLFKLKDMNELTAQINLQVGQEFAQLAISETRTATFTIAPSSSGEVQEDAGFTLVGGTATIEKVRALGPAARSGMSDNHIGWLITHVDGQVVDLASMARTAEELGESWQAGQTLTLTVHAPRTLYADPRARLLVTLKALQNARDHIGHIASMCIQENLH